MKLTGKMIDARMKAHKIWQEKEAERLTNEIWDAVFGSPQGTDYYGDSQKREYRRPPKRYASYEHLSDETVTILNGLGKKG